MDIVLSFLLDSIEFTAGIILCWFILKYLDRKTQFKFRDALAQMRTDGNVAVYYGLRLVAVAMFAAAVFGS